jgi:RHS repeat-associated protein
LRWRYAYDPLGQVRTARKEGPAAALLPGYDFGYEFDTIGNRVKTTTNGRSATYSANPRNQYLSRQVPPAVDVLGAVPPFTPGNPPSGANVVVDGQSPARVGKLFHRAVKVENSASPAFVDIKIIAARPGATDQVATETRSAFLPQTPETYDYDLDGNLTRDGRWIYSWDAENRLVGLETRTDVATTLPALPRQKLTLTYDAQGRRIRKLVQTWNGSAYATNTDTRFLYDGWNLLAEYSAANALVRACVWCPDLSGTAQGAGGVGGLLWATVAPGSTLPAPGTYAPAYDGNGNIVAWIDLADSNVAGRRDYGPFGEPLVTTGVAATLPFGFSTKYLDSETGLNYYGFRYYNPSTGRWLSRDPIEERGGLNLYAHVVNSPVNWIDPLGLDADAYSGLGGTVLSGKGLNGNCASSVLPGPFSNLDNNPAHQYGLQPDNNLDALFTKYILEHGCREVADLKECEKCKESGIALMTFDWKDKKDRTKDGPNFHIAGFNTCNDSWYGRPSPHTPYYTGIPAGNYDPDKNIGGRSEVGNYKRRNFCCKNHEAKTKNYRRRNLRAELYSYFGIFLQICL